MSYKVSFNIIDGFSKGFFGGTMTSVKRSLPANYKPSKLKFDSIDDLNEYFHKMVMESRDSVKFSQKGKSEAVVAKV